MSNPVDPGMDWLAAPRVVTYSENLSATAKVAYLVILDLLRNNDELPTRSEIARYCGCSLPTLRLALFELEDAHLLTVTKWGRNRSGYTFRSVSQAVRRGGL